MEQLFRKFAPLCAMVMKPNSDSVEFLGTAFAVHKGGYLITAAHVVKGQEHIVVSPATDVTGYQTSSPKLRCLVASVETTDEQNDLELLKFSEPINLKLPAGLFGDAETLVPGNPVMHLGYPFGKTGALALLMRSGSLAAKVETAQQVKQLYVEGVAYTGAAGGPLIDAARGRIIGVVNSQLGLVPPVQNAKGLKLPIQLDLTYAAPIEVVLE
ncbi:MAG: S1 family peptidase, partial [Gammaproteobacteria bacterium]